MYNFIRWFGLLVLFCNLFAPYRTDSNDIAEEDQIENDQEFVPYLTDQIEYLPGARIVGGRVAAPNQFPYQVSVRRKGEHICGGAIYSRTYVITAAHCVERIKGEAYAVALITIRAGTNLISNGGTVAKVKTIKVHDKYNNRDNDIALLELDAALTFGPTIKSIPLLSASVPVGSRVIISGWGLDNALGRLQGRLQFNNMTVISNAECSRIVGSVPNSVLCLAHERGNGACRGDFGGPAIYRGLLVGVSNFITKSCGTNSPDGYAKISALAGWVVANAV